MKQCKAGVLGGWNWGDAMVVQRLPDGSWSAPCFLRLRYGSLGLTLGMQSMRSVYVLQAREGGWCGEGRGGGALVPAGGCMQRADMAELATATGSWLHGACPTWFLSQLKLTGPLPAARPSWRPALQSAAQIAAFTHDSTAATIDATMPAELDPFELNASIKSIR